MKADFLLSCVLAKKQNFYGFYFYLTMTTSKYLTNANHF